ncbi:hypothetical protein GAG94_08605 [Lysinibacillus sphaericus]|nr:hypothetical protein GAG94_08605 [Lysinibacillus sphaericus]
MKKKGTSDKASFSKTLFKTSHLTDIPLYNFDSKIFEESSSNISDFANYIFKNEITAKNNHSTSDIEVQIMKRTSSTTKKLSSKSITNSDLANILITDHNFRIHQEILYIWSKKNAHYIPFEKIADKFIRQNIPNDFKGKITKNSINEIVEWIRSFPDLDLDDSVNKVNQNYVSFENFIFDFNNNITLEHTPLQFMTSKINANLLKGTKYGTYFEKFLNDITNGDMNLYYRIQELFGYIISEIRNVKYIPILYGPKDTGKSIILQILEYLVGKNNVSNLSFDQLSKPDYLSNMVGKRLNSCGETSELSLGRLDVLKKLSGGDRVTIRPLYGQPFDFVNTAVLLFAGNNLPYIKNHSEARAFIDRLIIIPFLNPIPKNKQDKDLFEKLTSEIDYIAQWAIVGLQRWQRNNFQFTETDFQKEILERYYPNKNNVLEFLEDQCIIDSNYKIHKYKLEKAYHHYCSINKKQRVSKKEFNETLINQAITPSKFRINDKNRHGYYGLTLIDENLEGDKNNA